MANDENKIILEFPATNIELDIGETITFDNITGLLPMERVDGLEDALDEKANTSDVYTKSQTDNLLNDKADVSDLPDMTQYYDKSEVNTTLSTKADQSDFASLANDVNGLADEVEALDQNKADKSTTYTKTEVDNALNGKMDKENPTGTGSFSMHREEGSTVGSDSFTANWRGTASGNNSFAEGFRTTASGATSHSEGYQSTASGAVSHAEGFQTTAGNYSHAEGYTTKASGSPSHAEGYNTIASGASSHSEGYLSTASGKQSHAEGRETIASGDRSHAEGYGTTASGRAQHVSGTYNIADDNDTYAEIIGNGTDINNRSNARTLDWNGNEVLAGNLTLNGNKKIILNLDGTVTWETLT